MRFDSTLNLNRKGLMASSLGGLILLFTIFSLPTLLAASLEPDQAEKGIRYYLKHDAMAEHLEQLKVAGLNSPNRKIAERWENDLKYIEQMEFISLEIRHFLFAPPTSSTRIFMVKAVLRDTENHERVCYFSLSARNRFFDFFWVNEHSKWKCFFSI